MTEVGRLLTTREVEQKVIDLVRWARARYNIPVGCGGERACQLVGLRYRRDPLHTKSDGALIEGCVVVSKAVTWSPRTEFTIYHEILHHLLLEDGELIEFFTSALRSNPHDYEAAIERCCHQGAAEFLMPQDQIREIIAARRFSADLILEIAEKYGASIIAASIQLAVCAPIDCFVVLCSYGPVARWPPYTGLHVEYAFPSWRGRRHYWLARFSKVPSDHLIAEAWNAQADGDGPSYVPFPSGKRMPCHCQARLLHRRICAILALEDGVPESQLALPLGDL